ncbi:MAG: peptidoglycan-binding domain-containing protein [Phycisphaerales bacterium]
MAKDPLLTLAGQPLEQLSLLESRLEEAAEKDIVRPLPTTQEEFTEASFAPDQLRTLRNRLYRLGYLDSDSQRDAIDGELRQAVRRFQEETELELTPDGWVGVQTWQALQELFAFEPPTELKRWFKMGRMTAALHRAVYLRLLTFGMLDPEPQASLAPFDAGLAKWDRVLDCLGAEPVSADGDVAGLGRLERLFDLEGILSLIYDGRRVIYKRLMERSEPDRRLVRGFLVCLLKIELWLLGYERVEPDRFSSKPLRRRLAGGGKRTRYTDSPLYVAIRQFWRDQRMAVKYDEPLEVLVRTASKLGEIYREESQGGDKATELIAALAEAGDQLEDAWKQASWGARVWDGVKRVWRFLSRLVRRTARSIVDFVKEKLQWVIRAAQHAVAHACSLLHRGFRIVADFVDFLFCREMKGSTREVAIRHDRDFDFRVFVSNAASTTEVATVLDRLRSRTERFHVVLRVCGMFITLAVASAQAAAGPWMWWRLLRTLIRLHQDITDDDVRLIAAPLSPNE